MGIIENKQCCNRILIVDDNIDIRLLLKKRLENAGYEVVTAENGLEATQSILSTPPCVVILDLMMPVMDGWEFIEWKNKQNDDLVKVPVVVVSAVTDFTKAPPGIAGFLKKPVNVLNMIDYIQSFC